MSGKRKAADIEYLQRKLQRLQNKIDALQSDSTSSSSVEGEQEQDVRQDPSQDVRHDELGKNENLQVGKSP